MELRGAEEPAFIVPYDHLCLGRISGIPEGMRRSPAIRNARTRAQKYLLERGMIRSLRTGEVIDRRWMLYAF